MTEDEKCEVIFACTGVPQMLRNLADDRRPGPVADLARKQADRVQELMRRYTE